jgi:hypothetical protein
MSNYRNKTLRESAKHESCVSCGSDDGTIVWAHSNRQKHGKGMGIKAHDLFGCYLCHQCHSSFDSGKVPDNTAFYSVNEGLVTWFNCMWERSMIIACEKGYI